MRARRLVSRAPHELAVEDHEVSDRPPPGGILAEAAVTLVSAGTEIANYQGRTAQRPLDDAEPYYPGYSFAGTVLAAGIELGDRVAVVGAGVVGLLAGRLARLAGGRRITALDLLQARREAATRNRAYAAVDPADPAADDRLAEIAPGGFDVVFEATESADGFRSAFRLAGRGARVVLLGSTRELVDGFDPYADVHLKGLRVLGAHVSTTPTEATLRDRWTEAENRRVLLELMQRGELDVDALVSHRIAPDDAPQAFAALAARPQEHLGIVI